MAETGMIESDVSKPLIADWASMAKLIAELNRSIELNAQRKPFTGEHNHEATEVDRMLYASIVSLCRMMSTCVLTTERKTG